MNNYRFLACFFTVTILCPLGYQTALAEGTRGSPRFVDCDKKGSINEALASDRFIEFTGNCDEDVIVEGVTELMIRGFGPSPAENRIRSLRIFGPASVQLENFASDGVDLSIGVGGTATNIELVDRFRMRFGSNMFLSGITVTSGTVAIAWNSMAVLTGVSITGNASDQALQVLADASAILESGTIVNNSAEDAIVVANSSRLLINDGTVQGGTTVTRVGALAVRDGTIDDVVVAAQSQLSARAAATLSGNIRLREDSALINEVPAQGSVTVGGSVICDDFESSLVLTDFVFDLGTNCTDFDF